jgi:hypothetical protein
MEQNVMKKIISLGLCLLILILSGCALSVTLKDGVPTKDGQTGNAVYDGVPSYPGESAGEAVRIPIHSDEDWALVDEWLRSELFADDYYEAVSGHYYNSPVDVVNEPVSRFDKYVAAE